MRAHPIVRAGLLLIAFRIGGLALRYGLQATGSAANRAILFATSAAMHAGTLALIVAVLLFAAEWRPRWRTRVSAAACVLFAVLMIAGLADLIVSTITGAPLTPTVFRTYRGLQVVESQEFLQPVRANAGAIGAGVLIFGALVIGMAAIVRRGARDSASALPRSGALALTTVAIALCWLPTRASGSVPPPPIEWAIARDYLGLDRAALRGSESEAFARVRAFVGLPQGAEWVDAAYPLAYRWRDPAPPRASDPPDIVIVMIESLRAEELAWVTGASDSASPTLDALAAKSVVFPTYISNAFPSAPSVLAFHCSAWPHRTKEIVTDFPDRAFDSIPARLRTMGYDTIYVGPDPRFDNQSRWLTQWYSTTIDLVSRGTKATDRAIVGRAIDEIARHDAQRGNGPLFEWISTYSLHYPFAQPADDDDRAVDGSQGVRAQYRRVLQYTDRQVESLLAFLQTRARRDRTVTIVVGDHAFYTNLRLTSGLPENDNEWTAAIVSGPADLVGAPRRIVEPASHVDMLPTILAMVGDRRPAAALGSDLFGAPRAGARRALAIRPGGWRLDEDGDSLIVDERAPNAITRRVAFPMLAAPARPQPRASVGLEALSDVVNTWSYLVERNRVWNDALLAR